MKIREVVRVDSKGRITIPLVIRNALDIREGMSVLLVADPDKKEFVVTPISNEARLMEIEFEIEDRPGALAEVATKLAELGIDMVITRCTTIRRGENAECLIVVDVSRSSISSDRELEGIIKYLEPIRMVRVRSFQRFR